MDGFFIFIGLAIVGAMVLVGLASWVSSKFKDSNVCPKTGKKHDFGDTTKIGSMNWRKCKDCGEEQCWYDNG